MVPVLPFTIINFVAGASTVPLRDYVLGTLMGMAPGVLAMTVLEKGLETAIRDPGIVTFSILLLIVVMTLLALKYVRALLKRTEQYPRPG